MIERINKNESRLDKSLECLEELTTALSNFDASYHEFKLLNRYYGSKNWLKDKENYEKGNIPRIKAGVLSEDSVWNLLEELDDTIKEMQKIIKKYQNVKKL